MRQALRHDVRLRAAGSLIYGAVYPSDECAPDRSRTARYHSLSAGGRRGAASATGADRSCQTAGPAVMEAAMRLNNKGETFGSWLLAQREREGWIGDLVKAARVDPKFPKQGDPEAIRARLREVQREGDMFEAVDDAETDWLSY